jgi:DNA-binding NarL/FixJ family response regulator
MFTSPARINLRSDSASERNRFIRKAASMPLNILLVDDNPTYVTAVRHFLDRLPGALVVGEAQDGKTALALVRERAPDVVLLDIAMPGMNGLELARALMQLPQPPRIIFLSMHDNQEYRLAAHDLGAEFVSKSDFVAQMMPALSRMVTTRQDRTDPPLKGSLQ